MQYSYVFIISKNSIFKKYKIKYTKRFLPIRLSISNASVIKSLPPPLPRDADQTEGLIHLNKHSTTKKHTQPQAFILI